MEINAIDLFCGAGGLSYGMKQAGINVKAGIDLDSVCEFPYEENIKAKFLLKDVSTVTVDDLSPFYSDNSIKVLAGCAPCQPFSTLRNGSDRESNDKWPLLNEFGRLVKEILPNYVTMENVPALKGQTVFDNFVKTLEDHGYFVTSNVVNAADYGVAQRRRRLVLLASRTSPIKLLSPSELGYAKITVRDAISQLPSISSGETDSNDPLHKARALKDINIARIRASLPGGTWMDWPESLRSPCHTREQGLTFKSVYARMEWDKPSPTITTQATNFGTGRFGHPEQDRALSLREMAILQSFPPDYKFTPENVAPDFTSIGRLIGNAVPVNLGYAVGASITHHIKMQQQDANDDKSSQLSV